MKPKIKLNRTYMKIMFLLIFPFRTYYKGWFLVCAQSMRDGVTFPTWENSFVINLYFFWKGDPLSFAVKVKYKRHYGTIMMLHIIFARNILTFSFAINNQSSVAIFVCLSSTFTKTWTSTLHVETLWLLATWRPLQWPVHLSIKTVYNITIVNSVIDMYSSCYGNLCYSKKYQRDVFFSGTAHHYHTEVMNLYNAPNC